MSEPIITEATGRNLDPDFLRRTIEHLCDLWDKALEDELEFRGELDAARAVAIHTHAHHAAKLGRAILTLDETGSGAELVPLVRFLLECGVTAAWLLVTDGSGQTLIRDGAEQRRKALAKLSALGENVSPGYEQALNTLADLESASKSYQVEQRCNTLRGGEQLYVLFRVLSAESHAGLGIADLYSISQADSPIGIAFHQKPAFTTRVSALGITACMLLVSINADELARSRPHRTTQIRKAAKRLGVGTSIVRKDGFQLPQR